MSDEKYFNIKIIIITTCLTLRYVNNIFVFFFYEICMILLVAIEQALYLSNLSAVCKMI